MGILDEAIREHLELKRQHGADDSEVQQLEDEAFGPPERPGSEPTDPLAEAPTEFMAQPETAEERLDEQQPRREAPSIADLQEAPEQAAPEDEGSLADEEPAEEEHPAMEHETVPEPPEQLGPSTEERHAIADQPTEHFDIEEELAASGPPNPTDEELVEEEIAEPRLAPTDPLAGLDEIEEGEVTVEETAAEEEDEDDEFFDEKRLSDELDQALEAPAEPAPEEDPEPEEDEPEPTEPEAPRADEDVLEDTPDFLEDAPEDDQLWFEQKPPKDFDFDD